MPGFGPPPNPMRRRRNRDTFAEASVTVSTDGTVHAPQLPNADDFSRHTREWYRTWCSSPQAQAFVATDWQRLHMLAPLVERYFAEPRKDLLAEIRLNEGLLGATHVDRLRARITITPPADQSRGADSAAGDTPEVARLDERRRRLGGGAS